MRNLQRLSALLLSIASLNGCGDFPQLYIHSPTHARVQPGKPRPHGDGSEPILQDCRKECQNACKEDGGCKKYKEDADNNCHVWCNGTDGRLGSGGDDSVEPLTPRG